MIQSKIQFFNVHPYQRFGRLHLKNVDTSQAESKFLNRNKARPNLAWGGDPPLFQRDLDLVETEGSDPPGEGGHCFIPVKKLGFCLGGMIFFRVKPSKSLIGMHIEKLDFRVYHAFASFYYQTLIAVHIEKLDFRVYHAFASFYYQTL